MKLKLSTAECALHSPPALSQQSILTVAQGLAARCSWQNPEVNRTVFVVDLGPESKQEEVFAVEAEDLEVLILSCISIPPNKVCQKTSQQR